MCWGRETTKICMIVALKDQDCTHLVDHSSKIKKTLLHVLLPTETAHRQHKRNVHLFLKVVLLIGKHAGQETFILLCGNTRAKGIVYSSCTLESCPVAQWQLNTSISEHRHIQKLPYQYSMGEVISRMWLACLSSTSCLP